MKGRFLFNFVILWGFLLLFLVPHAFATQQGFPSCTNPTGTVIAPTSSGEHGIAGYANTANGEDTVYSLDSSRVLQCFCNSNGGIQTNWLNASGLTKSELQTYENNGWIYIQDGSMWGLQESPYLAYNIQYTCNNAQSTGQNTNSSNSGGGNGGGGTGVTTPTCNDTEPSSAPNITSIVNGQNSVTLTWTPAGNPVSYYLIAYGTQPGTYTFGNPNVGNVLTYTINGLSGGKTYYFAVKGVNGCKPGPYSNEVSNNVQGNALQGPANGFVAGVLGAADPKAISNGLTITKSICAACFWWPVLLGEIAALVALYLLLKRGSIKVNKYLLGTIVGLTAYIVFLFLNKGHVCPDAGIGFWRLSIPCRYFWALDGIIILLFSWVIRSISNPITKKASKRN